MCFFDGPDPPDPIPDPEPLPEAETPDETARDARARELQRNGRSSFVIDPGLSSADATGLRI